MSNRFTYLTAALASLALAACAADEVEDLDPAATLGGEEMSDDGPLAVDMASDVDTSLVEVDIPVEELEETANLDVIYAGRPAFQLPFPCGQVWAGQTRTNHSPPNSVDFNRTNDIGDTVVAAASGTVTRVANEGNTSYGRWIEIAHGGGYRTRYAHLSVQIGARRPARRARPEDRQRRQHRRLDRPAPALRGAAQRRRDPRDVRRRRRAVLGHAATTRARTRAARQRRWRSAGTSAASTPRARRSRCARARARATRARRLGRRRRARHDHAARSAASRSAARTARRRCGTSRRRLRRRRVRLDRLRRTGRADLPVRSAAVVVVGRRRDHAAVGAHHELRRRRRPCSGRAICGSPSTLSPPQ